MLVLLVVIAVIVIAAVSFVAVSRTGGHRLLGGRGRGPASHRPLATGRRGRASRAGRHRTTDERVLFAEGQEIQQDVEARLSARGVAPHRLSGPNPPTAAERVAPQALADARAQAADPGIRAYGARGRRRRHAPPPLATDYPPAPPTPVVAPSGTAPYGAPDTVLPQDPYPYAGPDPHVPVDPGYGDGRSLGGRRLRFGSRRSGRDSRDLLPPDPDFRD
jgi:hypothetical protein